MSRVTSEVGGGPEGLEIVGFFDRSVEIFSPSALLTVESDPEVEGEFWIEGAA
jgi:hypothetical protein